MYAVRGGKLMIMTKIFKNGNSQAIRIPQEMRTEKKEYYINKIGDIYIAVPADDPWAAARLTVGTFPKDFIGEREQPSWQDVQSREDI